MVKLFLLFYADKWSNLYRCHPIGRICMCSIFSKTLQQLTLMQLSSVRNSNRIVLILYLFLTYITLGLKPAAQHCVKVCNRVTRQEPF